MLQNSLAAPLAGQIEIRVVAQVHQSRCIGGGAIMNIDVVVGQCKGGPHPQGPGVARIAIRTFEIHCDCGRRALNEVAHRPVLFAESNDSAVQGMDAVIGGELVMHAIEYESTMRDSIGVAAERRADIVVTLYILLRA